VVGVEAGGKGRACREGGTRREGGGQRRGWRLVAGALVLGSLSWRWAIPAREAGIGLLVIRTLAVSEQQVNGGVTTPQPDRLSGVDLVWAEGPIRG